MTELLLLVLAVVFLGYAPGLVRADAVPPWPPLVQEAVCGACLVVGAMCAVGLVLCVVGRRRVGSAREVHRGGGV